MSDDAFVEWLNTKRYVPQQTRLKNQHKLYRNDRLFPVSGLEKVTRKKLVLGPAVCGSNSHDRAIFKKLFKLTRAD